MRAPRGIYRVAQSRPREKSDIELAAEKICRRFPGDANAEARAVIRDLAGGLESTAYLINHVPGTLIAQAIDELIDVYNEEVRWLKEAKQKSAGGASE